MYILKLAFMFMYHVACLTDLDLLYGGGVSSVLQGHICSFPSKEGHCYESNTIL